MTKSSILLFNVLAACICVMCLHNLEEVAKSKVTDWPDDLDIVKTSKSGIKSRAGNIMHIVLL